MEEKKKYNKTSIYMGVDSFFSLAILIISLSMTRQTFASSHTIGLMAVLMFVIGVENVIRGLITRGKSKLSEYRFYCHAVLYVLLGGIVIITGGGLTAMRVFVAVLYLIFASNRVVSAILNHRIYNIIFQVLFMGVLVYALYMAFGISGELGGAIIEAFIFIPISFWAIFHILAISFYRIQVDTLLKIVKRTYALQVLFGLLMIIVTFSFVFQMFEPSMAKYSDALWYCFALVTTIGFGDIVAITPIGRVMSVFLGIYGILVVAMITSVVVNFYNEVRNESDDSR